MILINVGLNFYSLYLRRNSDGSESESIATLATDLDYHSGIDVNVEPNLVTQIKVKEQEMCHTKDKLHYRGSTN